MTPSPKITQLRRREYSPRRRTLRFSEAEGCLWALMVGSFETFFMYYIVKKEVSHHELAILATVPNLFGSIANWLLPLVTSKKFLKPAILATVGLQSIGIALMLLSFSHEQVFSVFFVALSLYWIGGLAASPLWIDWISGWLPPGRFGRFVSRRNGLNALISLLTYLSIALLLFRSTAHDLFIYPFTIACAARTVSMLMLARQPTPPSRPLFENSKPIDTPLFKSPVVLMVILFSALFKFASNIATPFLVPYMMNGLHLNLIQYAWLIGVPFLGRALMFSHWGEVMRNHSPLVVLQISMFLSSCVLLGWTRFTTPVGLTFTEFTSGMAWGGFELACVLCMQSFRPGQARSLIGMTIALQNFSAIGGALLGSYFLTMNLKSIEVIRISTFARFLVVFLFLGTCFRLHTPRTTIKQIKACLFTLYQQITLGRG